MTTNPASAARPIIVLTHEFFPRRGGIATYTQEVARALANRGERVEVWAPADPALADVSFPFKIRALPLKGSQDWICRIRLALHLARNRKWWRDAVLYVPEPGPLRTWMYWQHVQAPPGGLVVTLHGSEILRLTAFRHRRALLGNFLRRANRIGVVSGHVADVLGRCFPDVAGKTVIAHGALRTDLAPAPTAGEEAREHESIRLLTVGRIHPRKGQLAVLEALSLLPAEQRRRVQYLMAGPIVDQVYFRRITDYARAWGITISHLGIVPEQELSKIYADADIFAMTSLPNGSSVEGFGLTYLEASAHGLPILAHRIGGVEDAVKENITGLLIDPDDRGTLAHCIQRLCEDPSLRLALGAGGRRWVEQFSWQATAAKLFDDLPTHPHRIGRH